MLSVGVYSAKNTYRSGKMDMCWAVKSMSLLSYTLNSTPFMPYRDKRQYLLTDSAPWLCIAVLSLLPRYE